MSRDPGWDLCKAKLSKTEDFLKFQQKHTPILHTALVSRGTLITCLVPLPLQRTPICHIITIIILRIIHGKLQTLLNMQTAVAKHHSDTWQSQSHTHMKQDLSKIKHKIRKFLPKMLLQLSQC